MNQQAAFEEFRHLSPIEPAELAGLWKARGICDRSSA